MSDKENRTDKVFDGKWPEADGKQLPAIPPGEALMHTKAGYQQALEVRKPRNLAMVEAATIEESRMLKKQAYYRWPVKKGNTIKIIQGGTIDLAMVIARNWTNCYIPLDEEDRGTRRMLTTSFVDIESGFTVTRKFESRKTVVKKGEYSNERVMDMEFQAAQSRAIRNVIFKGTPSWLQEKAIETAIKAQIGHPTKEEIAESVAKSIKTYLTINVQESQLVELLGKSADKWGALEIDILRDFWAQIEEGAEVHKFFPPYRGRDDKKKAAPTTQPPATSPKGTSGRHAPSKTEKAANQPPEPAETAKTEPPVDDNPPAGNQTALDPIGEFPNGIPARLANVVEAAKKLNDNQALRSVLDAYGISQISQLGVESASGFHRDLLRKIDGGKGQ